MFKKKKNLDQPQSLSSDVGVGGNPQQAVVFKGRRKLFTKKRLIVVAIILVIGFCAGGVVVWKHYHKAPQTIPLGQNLPPYVGIRDDSGSLITDPQKIKEWQQTHVKAGKQQILKVGQ